MAGLEHAHLAEEVARPELGDLVAVAHHLGGALLDREQLVGVVALVGEVAALVDLQLVDPHREALPHVVGEPAERRQRVEAFDVHGARNPFTRS